MILMVDRGSGKGGFASSFLPDEIKQVCSHYLTLDQALSCCFFSAGFSVFQLWFWGRTVGFTNDVKTLRVHRLWLDFSGLELKNERWAIMSLVFSQSWVLLSMFDSPLVTRKFHGVKLFFQRPSGHWAPCKLESLNILSRGFWKH